MPTFRVKIGGRVLSREASWDDVYRFKNLLKSSLPVAWDSFNRQWEIYPSALYFTTTKKAVDVLSEIFPDTPREELEKIVEEAKKGFLKELEEKIREIAEKYGLNEDEYYFLLSIIDGY